MIDATETGTRHTVFETTIGTGAGAAASPPAAPAPDARPALPAHAGGERRPSLAGAALRGAAAGVAGGLAMMAVMRLTSALQRGAGTVTETPGELVAGRYVRGDGAAAAAAGTAAHLGSSAAWGAVYGMVQSRLHAPHLLHGALLGGLSYAAMYPSGGLLPRMGLLPPPTQQSLGKAAAPVDASLAFGLTTALVFDALS